MLNDEKQTQIYSLFDHSYAGGSWNLALIAQVDTHRRRAEAAEARTNALQAEQTNLRAIAEAAEALRRHVWECEDCADENGCEQWQLLDGVLNRQLAAVYGKPGE